MAVSGSSLEFFFFFFVEANFKHYRPFSLGADENYPLARNIARDNTPKKAAQPHPWHKTTHTHTYTHQSAQTIMTNDAEVDSWGKNNTEIKFYPFYLN